MQKQRLFNQFTQRKFKINNKSINPVLCGAKNQQEGRAGRIHLLGQQTRIPQHRNFYFSTTQTQRIPLQPKSTSTSITTPTPITTSPPLRTTQTPTLSETPVTPIFDVKESIYEDEPTLWQEEALEEVFRESIEWQLDEAAKEWGTFAAWARESFKDDNLHNRNDEFVTEVSSNEEAVWRFRELMEDPQFLPDSRILNLVLKSNAELNRPEEAIENYNRLLVSEFPIDQSVEVDFGCKGILCV